MFLLASVVDLPGQIPVVGNVSLSGVLTIATDAAAAVAILMRPTLSRRVLKVMIPYALFLAWCLGSVIVAPPVGYGLQNLTVYVELGLITLLAGVLASEMASQTAGTISRALSAASWIGLLLVALNVAIGGITLSGAKGANTWLIQPRSFALVGLIPLSWHLSEWYAGRKISVIRALLWVGAIGLSLSRTAAATGIVLVGATTLATVRFQTRRSLLIVPIILALLGAGIDVAFSSRIVQNRFFGEDASIHIGDVSINAMGRLVLWRAALGAAEKHPWVGSGLGEASVVSEEAIHGMDHPHDDYLRLLDDVGIVGLGLFCLAIALWALRLWLAWFRKEKHRVAQHPLHLAAILAFAGILASMVTDNSLVYPYMMGPLGILIGASVGLRSRGL